MEDTILFARRIMDANGLNFWKVKTNKATTIFGSCSFKTKTVIFSHVLLPHCSSSAKKDVVLHEIAHAIVGEKHGHDDVWRQKAIELGGSGNRTGCDDYFECNDYSVIRHNHYKYKAVCANGHTHYRNRKPLIMVSCKDCEPTFNKLYILDYKPQQTPRKYESKRAS